MIACLVVVGVAWGTLGVWRVGEEGLVWRGIKPIPVLLTSTSVIIQSLTTISLLLYTSLTKMIVLSLIMIGITHSIRRGGMVDGLSGIIGGVMVVGGGIVDEVLRSDSTNLSIILLMTHLALIPIIHVINTPSSSYQQQQQRKNTINHRHSSSFSSMATPATSSPTVTTTSATPPGNITVAIQRIERERIWKLSVMVVGPIIGVISLLWVSFYPAPINLPTQSDLITLLLTTSLLSLSLLFQSPSSSSFSKSFHILIPSSSPSLNLLIKGEDVGKVFVGLIGSTFVLENVFWMRFGGWKEVLLVIVGYLAIQRINPLQSPTPNSTISTVPISTAYEPYSPSFPSSASFTIPIPKFLPSPTRSLLSHILRSPESSKIFYFLLLNMLYMVVQVLWGVWTNSLGLISDAIHMAFDCAALAMGLFASVMATWRPTNQYTYGYGRMETLSGFANGIFLILISVFIIFEAVQRVMDPPEMMNMRQLLLVSSGGLAVNLWGMYATGGHHHGHSHDHEEDNHSHDDHHHSEGHSHNMRGVFLHVMADTLGSVGVILSTILIDYTGWTVFDPIASLFIAAMIVVSVLPLVIDSARVLMLELSEEKETELRQALSELNAVEGLEFYAAPRFWPKSAGSVVGSIHIHLTSNSDLGDTSCPVDALSFKRVTTTYANAEKVVAQVEKILKSRVKGLRDLTIQVEGLDCIFCPCTTGAAR